MDVKAVWERSYPYVIGIAAALAVARFGAPIVGRADAFGIDLRQIATAGLSIFILLTGLLFTVYVIAIAPGGGFLERIFRTQTFNVFRRYVMEALILGALATVSVVPLMATAVATTHFVWSTWFLAPTVALATSASGAFVRVSSVFLILVGIAAQPKR